MANFSEEQLNRYEIFRRSAFQKSSIKKIVQTVCAKSVSASVVIGKYKYETIDILYTICISHHITKTIKTLSVSLTVTLVYCLCIAGD